MFSRAIFLLPALVLFSMPASADFLKNIGKSVDRSIDRRVNKVERKVDQKLDVERNLQKAEREALKAAENADSKTGVHECGTGDDLLLEDITIKVPKKQWAVVVRGACTLTLKNVRIQGARGLLISGAAVVSLEKVRIQTERRGITTAGAVSVKMVKSQVRVRDKENAAIVGDEGLKLTLVDSKVYAKAEAFKIDNSAVISVDEKSRINGKKYPARK